jgi:hypothetical protein
MGIYFEDSGFFRRTPVFNRKGRRRVQKRKTVRRRDPRRASAVKGGE